MGWKWSWAMELRATIAYWQGSRSFLPWTIFATLLSWWFIQSHCSVLVEDIRIGSAACNSKSKRSGSNQESKTLCRWYRRWLDATILESWCRRKLSCYIARVNKPRVSYAGANILVKDKIPCIPVYLAFTVRYLVYSKVFEATYQYHDLSKADNNIVVLAVLVLDIGINHVWSDLEGVQTATGASSLLRRYELWLIFFSSFWHPYRRSFWHEISPSWKVRVQE